MIGKTLATALIAVAFGICITATSAAPSEKEVTEKAQEKTGRAFDISSLLGGATGGGAGGGILDSILKGANPNQIVSSLIGGEGGPLAAAGAGGAAGAGAGNQTVGINPQDLVGSVLKDAGIGGILGG